MRISFLVLLLLLLLFLFSSSDSLQQQTQPPPPTLHMKIKTLLTHAQSYLFPPNLDFRGSLSNDEPSLGGANGIEGGAGDKVKEAVAKSLGKGKATVEETAKSAADLAKEKMHQTAQKLKDTLSSHHEPQDL